MCRSSFHTLVYPAVFAFLLIVVFGPAMGENENHVVVVGGGLAGLSAALEAAKAGAKVTLIEGEKSVGGNSMKASSGINGCGTKAQQELQIKDSVDLFYGDTMSAGDQENLAHLVDILVHDSNEAIEFLMEKGVNLMSVNILGGHSVPRTHWLPSQKEGKPMPIGVAIIGALSGVFSKLVEQEPERVRLLALTKVTDLITGDVGSVVGVKTVDSEGNKGEVRSSAVILTTGGFSNDHTEDSLLKEFAPSYMNYPTTNGVFATGSGVKIARRVGAKLIDMEYVQVHPTGFVDPKDPSGKTKFLAAEALRGSGGILLNQEGNRFVNELGRRDRTTEKILSDCKKDPAVGAHVSWLLMNEAAIDKFGWPAFNFYWKIKGFFTKTDNADKAAELMKVKPENLRKTINEYREIVAGNEKDPFDKKVFPVPFAVDEPLYVGIITPSIHYTMGGVEITANAEVVKEKSDGRTIPGLFGAGEVTGGVHGKNRLGGNSLLECVVFGRIAGHQAAGGNKRLLLFFLLKLAAGLMALGFLCCLRKRYCNAKERSKVKRLWD